MRDYLAAALRRAWIGVDELRGSSGILPVNRKLISDREHCADGWATLRGLLVAGRLDDIVSPISDENVWIVDSSRSA